MAYDPVKAQAVLRHMSSEGMSARKACEAEGLSHRTFLDWVDADKELATHYMRAREDAIEHMAAEILAISDEPAPITGSGTVDSGAVAQKRLQVDSRKWLLSKMAPKKYGDKLELSGDKENPIETKTALNVTGLSTAALAEILALKDAAN